MDNSELLELLRERGFQVKSASSTVDNISAESLKEEFAKKSADTAKKETSASAEEKPVAAPSVTAFVRTKEQIEEEKESAKEPVATKAVPPPPAPPPPSASKVMEPPSPGPVSPPAVSKAPAPPPVASPANTGPPQPAAPSQTAPPPIAAPSSPAVVGAPVSPVSAKDPAEETEEIRTITLKPPIVVRDLATELGVKPFKLISELMEMGIFASINQSLEEDVASKVAEKRGVVLEIRHRGEGAKAKKKN